jgi:hypothetical protein
LLFALLEQGLGARCKSTPCPACCSNSGAAVELFPSLLVCLKRRRASSYR